MNLVALIFALSLSLFHISDTYVVEHFEKEIREVSVSQFSFAKQQIKQSVGIQSPLVKVINSLCFQNYDYTPVTKYLFIKIRVLLL